MKVSTGRFGWPGPNYNIPPSRFGPLGIARVPILSRHSESLVSRCSAAAAAAAPRRAAAAPQASESERWLRGYNQQKEGEVNW